MRKKTKEQGATERGGVLRAARTRQKLSIQRLSVIAGVAESLISRVENGRQAYLELGCAAKLCDALGLSLDDLVLPSVRRRRSATAMDAKRLRGLLSQSLEIVERTLRND